MCNLAHNFFLGGGGVREENFYLFVCNAAHFVIMIKFLLLKNFSVRQVDGVGVFYKHKFIWKLPVSKASRKAKFHEALPMELQE